MRILAPLWLIGIIAFCLLLTPLSTAQQKPASTPIVITHATVINPGTSSGLGKADGRCGRGQRDAGPPSPSRARSQVRPAKLANQVGCAGAIALVLSNKVFISRRILSTNAWHVNHIQKSSAENHETIDFTLETSSSATIPNPDVPTVAIRNFQGNYEIRNRADRSLPMWQRPRSNLGVWQRGSRAENRRAQPGAAKGGRRLCSAK
jgi:hypothetical protein